MRKQTANSSLGPRSLLTWRGSMLRFARNPIAMMENLYNAYGDIVPVARGKTNIVFVFGPQYHQQILANPNLFHLHDFKSAPFQFPENARLMAMNTGLSLINGPEHKRIRRLMMPFFTRKHVETYHRDMVALTERMLGNWKFGDRVDIFAELEQIALWLSVKTLFGLECDNQGRALVDSFGEAMSLLYSIPTLVLPFNFPGLPFRRMVNVGNRLVEDVQALIDQKRALGGEEGDVLSLLLQTHDESGDQLSDEELIGQVAVLFRGSYPTTAAAMVWTLFLLCQHPRVFASLLGELKNTLGGESPSIEQLDKMTLLENVIKESMRLLPPTPWVVRFNIESVQLGPYFLPPRSSIILGIYTTHRNPALFEQPRRFLPERWGKMTPSTYAYLPFIAGPRMCLGATFAMFLMKIVLSVILQRFSLAIVTGTKVNTAGIRGLIPKGGLPVILDRPHIEPERQKVEGNVLNLIDW